LHCYSHVAIAPANGGDADSKPLLPMSLDLRGTLNWGWMLSHAGRGQLSVVQPIDHEHAAPKSTPSDLLRHWAEVLHRHRAAAEPPRFDAGAVRSITLPLAGALAHEGVADRTITFGPEGGFFSACSEDVYPNCWSATFAVDVVKKALKEEFLQDSIQAFRQKWRTTLGDYLRGPQQNLRFLLPLVYRNPVMTQRLGESILHGKSVVR
jgi:hypothetical protein